MNFWILKAKKIILVSIFIELLTLLSIFFILEIIGKNQVFSINEFIGLFCISTFLFYISGKYHDFSFINRSEIIKNLIKTIFVLTTSTVISKMFLFKEISIQILSFNLLLIIFYTILICISQILINKCFKGLELSKNKWIVFKEDIFWDFAKNNLLQKENKLFSDLIFANNIEDLVRIKRLFKNKIKGIICYKNSELFHKENYSLIKTNFKELEIISRVDWSLRYLYRVPPDLIKKDDIKRFTQKKITDSEYKIKTFFEIILSCFLLIISFPITLISSILIYLEDKGPIFYHQYRTGEKGKKIKIFKLRTMKTNAEKNGAQWSSRNDKSITKVGNILRETRIDEIPQLFSVLKGEMSLIGPRPERPEIETFLKDKIDNYSLKFLIKPGLSGWAQVNYSYGSSIYDSSNKLSYDIFYISNFSILLDLLIMLKTIKTVLKMEGSVAKN